MSWLFAFILPAKYGCVSKKIDDEELFVKNTKGNIIDSINVESVNKLLGKKVKDESALSLFNKEQIKFSRDRRGGGVYADKNENLKNILYRDVSSAGKVIIDGQDVTQKLRPSSTGDLTRSKFFDQWVDKDIYAPNMHQGSLAPTLGRFNAAYNVKKSNLPDNGQSLSDSTTSGYNFSTREKKCDYSQTRNLKKTYKTEGGEEIANVDLGQIIFKSRFDYDKATPDSATISVKKPTELKYVFNPAVMDKLQNKHYDMVNPRKKTDQLPAKSNKTGFKQSMFEDRRKRLFR